MHFLLGLTVLEWASFKENEEITRCLVVHGVCHSVLHFSSDLINYNLQYGREPLLEASSNGYLEIAKLLIDAGANVNKTDRVCSNVLLL